MASAALLSTTAARPGEPPSRTDSSLRWPFEPWAIPAWWLGWGFGWWRVSLRALERTSALAPTFALVAPWGAALAVAARLATLLAETGFYVVLWRAYGARLPYWRYAFHLALGSLLDLQAIELVTLRSRPEHVVPWLVAVAGPAGLPARFAHAHPVWCGAFAGLGLLTLARVGWVAWAQTRATGRPLGTTLAVTTLSWIVTHLTLAATLALLQGRSAPQ